MEKKRTYRIRDFGGFLMEEAKATLDLLLPRSCIICGKTLLRNEKFLCIYCEADLPLTLYWDRRKNPMADRLNALLQKRLVRELDGESGRTAVPLKYSYAAALFFYHGEDLYKKIPQRLKYMGDIAEGKFYASMLGRFLESSPWFGDIDLVVPVPLHWARRWSRGYNQAEVIGQAVAGRIGAEMRTDLLVRKKRTVTQTRLDVMEKGRNVDGAFALGDMAGIRPERYRHVLVVDDVFTTGATMAACMNVLQPFFGNGVRISCATLGFVTSG